MPDFGDCGPPVLPYAPRMINARGTRIVWLLLAGTVLCQCAALQKAKKKDAKEEKSQPKTQTLLVGTVELVNPEQRYVLIQCDPKMIVAPGSKLTCLDATGTTSTVIVTPERKGNFVAADIQEGNPRVKNLVLHVIHADLNALTEGPAVVSPGTLPSASTLSLPPLDGPLDSGLPPLNQDATIEPGSVQIPPGGIPLDPVPLAPEGPAPSQLPPVVE